MVGEERVVIDARYCGPPMSGNGGYTCGILAETISGPALVRLRKPGPLDRELRLSRGRKTLLLDGEEIIAEAGAAREEAPEIPRKIAFSDAKTAARNYIGLNEHAFPTCFVCGPDRKEGDGLRIFAGRVADSDVHAAPWIPHESLADGDGRVAPRYVWAALDCPGAFAVMGDKPSLIVLMRMTAHCEARVEPGRELVVIAWPIQVGGRRHTVGTALLGENGETLAWARSVWLQPGDWNAENQGADWPK